MTDEEVMKWMQELFSNLVEEEGSTYPEEKSFVNK